MELSLGLIILLLVISFVCEYFDTTLGMGYGTVLAPLLLLMGFAPLEVVPAVLLAEFASGLLASALLARQKHVHFSLHLDKGLLKNFSWFRVSHDLKIAIVLMLCGFIGPISAVLGAQILSPVYQSLYIGILVISIGLFILVTLHKHFRFSWPRIIGLGLFASFNKGFSGGGYGPVIICGQLLSGVAPKKAVSISALTEGVTSLVGFIGYYWIAYTFNWELAGILLLGSLLAIPASVKSIDWVDPKKLKLSIALFTILLGVLTLYKVFQTTYDAAV